MSAQALAAATGDDVVIDSSCLAEEGVVRQDGTASGAADQQAADNARHCGDSQSRWQESTGGSQKAAGVLDTWSEGQCHRDAISPRGERGLQRQEFHGRHPQAIAQDHLLLKPVPASIMHM